MISAMVSRQKNGDKARPDSDEGGCGNSASRDRPSFPDSQPELLLLLLDCPYLLLRCYHSGAGRLPHILYILFSYFSLFIFSYGSL